LVVEAVPRGLRLCSIFDAIAERRVELPVEAAIATFALSARALSAVHAVWGPHGAIDPRRVQLGVDGSVFVVRPGPEQAPHRTTLDEYLAPELRVDAPASSAGDAYALGAIGKRLFFRRADCPTRIRAICYWLAHVDARQRPQDLAALAGELESAAHNAGLDPTFGHIARVTRLLTPNTGRPLCSVSRDLMAREPSSAPRSGGCPV
jgi:hypothetical protein